ncbi:MAG: M28 family metallopeptidase [Aridibacter sp.]
MIKKENNSARKEEIKRQIEQVDCDDKNRLSEVKKLFTEVGASADEINVENFEDVQNVVVTVKGKSGETVVVGGHYDKTTLGCGVIDNWSGVVLTANLYKQCKTQNNQKTYKFVAFGKEEKGLIGSKAMVKAIPENQTNKFCAMVNFDSFGFTDLWALGNASDKKLIELAKKVAEKRKVRFEEITYFGASSDSRSFQKAGIPSITLSGLDENWRKYLHQDSDQIKNINFDKIYENFQFSIDFIKEIDEQSCGSFR